MKPFSLQSLLLGLTISVYMTTSGIKRKSLSPMGALAASIVGFLSISCGLRGFLVLIFYKLGSFVTKYKKDIKEKTDGDASKSAIRGPHQVLACSAIAVACSLYHALYFGEEQAIDFYQSREASSVTCAIIAHYAVCLGDTLSSELGMLSKSQPFLISAPWRKVPCGTNGGVTILGTLWGAIGGAIIGLATILLDMIIGLEIQLMATIIYGIICGLFGSLLDSLLGATLQCSYYDVDRKLIYCKKETKSMKHISGFDVLTNAQVNLASVIFITIVGGGYIAPFIFR